MGSRNRLPLVSIDISIVRYWRRARARPVACNNCPTIELPALRITFGTSVTVPLRLTAEIGVACDAACCYRSNHNLNRMTGRSDQ